MNATQRPPKNCAGTRPKQHKHLWPPRRPRSSRWLSLGPRTLLATAIEEVEVALQYDMITAEFAAAWLADIGALAFINVEPFTNKIAISE